MVTEPTGQNYNFFASGLSGLVAAHIRAHALEVNAPQHDAWQAQQAFHGSIWRWLVLHAPAHRRRTIGIS